MTAVWTAHVSCFRCNKEFILNRVTVADTYAALAIIPCPHCGAVPAITQAHHLSYFQSANYPHRKKGGSQAWHFSQYCSHWPEEDYVELDYAPADEVCNECRALVGS